MKDVADIFITKTFVLQKWTGLHRLRRSSRYWGYRSKSSTCLDTAWDVPLMRWSGMEKGSSSAGMSSVLYWAVILVGVVRLILTKVYILIPCADLLRWIWISCCPAMD